MKTALICLSLIMLPLSGVLAQHHPFHEDPNQATTATEADPVTVSIRWSDRDLCAMGFYVDVYELTVTVFADGAASVVLADYEEKMFALVRSSEEYGANADAFIEHIQDIPRQLVEIIREDASVLDSCANFSVALIGPP